MNKTLIYILGLALITPVYAATSAQPTPLDRIGGQPKMMNPDAMHDMMMQRFKQSDVDQSGALNRHTNHDGQVSMQEVQAAFMQRMQQQKSAGM